MNKIIFKKIRINKVRFQSILCTYRCKQNYYGSAVGENSTCTACPIGKFSAEGSQNITGCIVPAAPVSMIMCFVCVCVYAYVVNYTKENITEYNQWRPHCLLQAKCCSHQQYVQVWTCQTHLSTEPCGSADCSFVKPISAVVIVGRMTEIQACS